MSHICIGVGNFKILTAVLSYSKIRMDAHHINDATKVRTLLNSTQPHESMEFCRSRTQLD